MARGYLSHWFCNGILDLFKGHYSGVPSIQEAIVHRYLLAVTLPTVVSVVTKRDWMMYCIAAPTRHDSEHINIIRYHLGTSPTKTTDQDAHWSKYRRLLSFQVALWCINLCILYRCLAFGKKQTTPHQVSLPHKCRFHDFGSISPCSFQWDSMGVPQELDGLCHGKSQTKMDVNVR